jgi:isochorismate synthase EntC
MTDFVKGDLVRHDEQGIGRVQEASGGDCTVYFPRREKQSLVPEDELQLLSEAETTAYEMMKLAAFEVSREELPRIELGPRWKNGEMVLKPGDASAASKSIPIETFFHKVVMARDRLRVMEAQINAHKVLSDAEKVELQQYITRIYGSFTTFNVLFKDKQDFFVGQKGES